MYEIIQNHEIDHLKGRIDDSIIKEIAKMQTERFESYDNYNIIAFDWYNLKNKILSPSRILIYHDSEKLIFVCEDSHSFDLVYKMGLPDGNSDNLLYRFFYLILKEDFDFLESLEEAITETEDKLLTRTNSECADDIVNYRRLLLYLKKYYEQLERIFDGLLNNTNELISKDLKHNFVILSGRIDRLYANVLNIRDYVSQVREAYQAQIDIEQNNIMRTFTVVTSIFLPLTLIAGWYGMNLKMPEYTWNYGYSYVIVLSLIIIAILIIFFKKKKWF